MKAFDTAMESSAFEFREQLERRGFQAKEGELVGQVDGAPSVRVRVILPDAFPYVPPVVKPPEDFPRSWHREASGAMCLYGVDGRENLPWLNVDDFLAIVTRWLNESTAGWTDDSPDLDLERYFPHEAGPLVVYGDLDSLTGRFIQLKLHGVVVRVTGPGSIPARARGMKGNRTFGYVTAIGQPEAPPTSWSELRALIPSKDVATIEKAVRDGRIEYLIVRYTRGDVMAALALRMRRSVVGIGLVSVDSASETADTMTLRTGSGATILGQRSVVVVGAGAVGSFLCDLLARSGVGRLTIYDPDIVRPGNLVRHLAGYDRVGQPKPNAVRQVIRAQPFNMTDVTAVPQAAPPPHDAAALFSEFDLVIDATADGSATAVLADVARAEGSRLLSVCVQEDGQVVRVDVIPPIDGEAMPPTSTIARPGMPRERRLEAGCGDPVSLTPPFACVEAASLAARLAVGLLSGQPIPPAGVLCDYR